MEWGNKNEKQKSNEKKILIEDRTRSETVQQV